MSSAETDPWRRARALAAADDASFEAILAENLEPQAEYIGPAERTLYARGKRLRPLLTLLCARLVSQWPREQALPEKIVRAAVSIEMLHVATLIHDDIVDAAPIRRGLPSVSAARGTEVAVLIGDLQYVQAIRCFAGQVKTDADIRLVQNMLDVAFKLCCGELDELQTTERGPDRVGAAHHYMRVIDRKTSALFGLSCEVGATLAGAEARAVFCLSQYGRQLGTAFQIMDDLLDLRGTSEELGKRRGADIRERRYSLPILYALEADGGDSLLRRLMSGEQRADDDAIDEAARGVVASPAFWRAYDDARAASMHACSFLEAFASDAHVTALADLATYVVDRGFGDTPRASGD